jgi:hypothetical protein
MLRGRHCRIGRSSRAGTRPYWRRLLTVRRYSSRVEYGCGLISDMSFTKK